MSNFKAGDEAILVSVEPQWKVPVGTKVRVREPAVGSAGTGYFVELCTQPGSNIYYAEHRLGTVDDPLPPAPESVRYYHQGYHSIHADAFLDVHSGHFASGPRIRINDKNNRGITIDADTALQLAHDLRRMAMEIKRKEKQHA